MPFIRGAQEGDGFVEFVCDQLGTIDGITQRSMFGAYGLYCGGTFFGIAHKGALYLKTSPASRAQYEAWGMEPFQPNATQTLRSYYRVPEEFLEDAAKLQELAEEAIDAAIDGQGPG